MDRHDDVCGEAACDAPQWSPARTVARSLLLTCVMNSLRLNDALNAVLFEDEVDPAGVVHS